MANDLTLTSKHNCWQQAVKHERTAHFNFSDDNASRVGNLRRIDSNYDNLQQKKMKYTFYSRHLPKYMGNTVCDTEDQIPTEPLMPVHYSKRKDFNIDRTGSTLPRANFSPIQR